MANKTLNKWGIVLIRLVGLTAFIWQIIQFFYSKWTYDVWVEVLMLCLFFIIFRYPNRILGIFGVLTSKLNIKMKDEKTKEEFKEEELKTNQDVGGSDPDNEDEEV